jgi:hypothetical protein
MPGGYWNDTALEWKEFSLKHPTYSFRLCRRK